MKIKIKTINLPNYKTKDKYFRFNIYKNNVLRQKKIVGKIIQYPVVYKEIYLRVFKIVIEVEYEKNMKVEL